MVKKTNGSCSPLSNALRQHWLVPKRQFGVVVVPALWPEAAEQALCSRVSRTLPLTGAFGEVSQLEAPAAARVLLGGREAAGGFCWSCPPRALLSVPS